MEGEALSDLFFSLKDKGAHNINLVTPTHYMPTVAEAIDIARSKGLGLPIVYNTSSYESVAVLKKLVSRVDVYLADFKYYRGQTARELSKAEDYPEIARETIAEMVRQQPTPVIEQGLMKRGVIVRILLLPSRLAEAKLIVKELYSNYGDSIYISLMNQYTPPKNMPRPFDRPVTKSEYNELLDYALKLGVKNCFIQEGGTVSESFIPPFDYANN